MSKTTINTQHTVSYSQLNELLSVISNAVESCISQKELDNSNYVLAAALTDIAELIANVNQIITTKQDKELGKNLSTNDYSNDDKAKLNSLYNYNDTEVRNLINGLQQSLDTITGTNDTTDIIDTMTEIKNFLDSFKNSKRLSNVLSTLELNIKSWVDQLYYQKTYIDALEARIKAIEDALNNKTIIIK